MESQPIHWYHGIHKTLTVVSGSHGKVKAIKWEKRLGRWFLMKIILCFHLGFAALYYMGFTISLCYCIYWLGTEHEKALPKPIILQIITCDQWKCEVMHSIWGHSNDFSHMIQNWWIVSLADSKGITTLCVPNYWIRSRMHFIAISCS